METRDYKVSHNIQIPLHMITKQALSSAEPIRDDRACFISLAGTSFEDDPFEVDWIDFYDQRINVPCGWITSSCAGTHELVNNQLTPTTTNHILSACYGFLRLILSRNLNRNDLFRYI